MTDRAVSHITDDMVDKAARAHAENDGYDWPEVSAFWQERYRRFARVILSAALAGCTVVPDSAREELIGCHHPGWPDPLGFNWGEDPHENARRWFEENREKHPQIKVRRRLVTEWEDLYVADPCKPASGSLVGEQHDQ